MNGGDANVDSSTALGILTPANLLRSKMRELVARRPVEWLHAEVVYAFFPHSIKDRLSGRHERQAGEPARIEFKRRFLSILDRISDENGGVIRFAGFVCGYCFAVGSNVVGLGGSLDNCFGRATVNRNALEEMVFGSVDVVHPFAVVRTDRHSIVDAKSKA